MGVFKCEMLAIEMALGWGLCILVTVCHSLSPFYIYMYSFLMLDNTSLPRINYLYSSFCEKNVKIWFIFKIPNWSNFVSKGGNGCKCFVQAFFKKRNHYIFNIIANVFWAVPGLLSLWSRTRLNCSNSLDLDDDRLM